MANVKYKIFIESWSRCGPERLEKEKKGKSLIMIRNDTLLQQMVEDFWYHKALICRLAFPTILFPVVGKVPKADLQSKR